LVRIVYKEKKRHNHSFGVKQIIYFILIKDKEKIKETSLYIKLKGMEGALKSKKT
jgi:hypothetical protein